MSMTDRKFLVIWFTIVGFIAGWYAYTIGSIVVLALGVGFGALLYLAVGVAIDGFKLLRKRDDSRL